MIPTRTRGIFSLIGPFVLLFLAFSLYPLLRSLVLCVFKTTPERDIFVGLNNFRFMLTDRLFWFAFANTTAFTLAFVVVQLPLSLSLALLLNSPRVRAKAAFRFAFFSTHLVGPVFVAVIFSQLLDPHGPINAILSRLSFRTININWLNEPTLAMVCVLVAALWLSVGFAMIYLLAALQSVDPDQYDAAKIDGAGPVAQFTHVTLPAIRPVLSFLILFGMISGFQVFELPYVLFPTATGPGNAAITLVGYLYLTGITAGDLGYASAAGWVLVFIVAILSLAFSRATMWKERLS